MMYDKYTLDRCDALEWLAKNLVEWPAEIVDGISKYIGNYSFNFWYFVHIGKDEIVLNRADNRYITESDFYNFLNDYSGTELTRYGENEA